MALAQQLSVDSRLALECPQLLGYMVPVVLELLSVHMARQPVSPPVFRCTVGQTGLGCWVELAGRLIESQDDPDDPASNLNEIF